MRHRPNRKHISHNVANWSRDQLNRWEKERGYNWAGGGAEEAEEEAEEEGRKLV